MLFRSNFIAYALKGQTVKGVLNVSSQYIDAAQFMTEEKVEGSATDTGAVQEEKMSVIIVPKNIDFTLNTNIRKVSLGKIDFTDMRGRATVADGIAKLDGIIFNAFEGSVTATGAYNTQNEKKPFANMGFNIKDASFKSTFSNVESFRKMAPVFENMEGTYAMKLDIKTDIDKDFSPELNTMTGSGYIKSNNVMISNVKALDNLADALNYPALKTIKPNNLDISFEISEGKIITKPFSLKMGNNSLTLGGTTSLDQTMNYSGNVTLGDGVKIAGVRVTNLQIGRAHV